MEDDVIEQTLHICREIKVYRIPPRPGATGYRSGEWKVADQIFTGRLRMIAKGEYCEIRLEDPNSGDLFAMCPVPPGKRAVAVEPVSDSSRYFVLRVEDPVSRRHAFLGLGFDNRGDAFDFSAALSDHERLMERTRASEAAASAAAAGGPGSSGGRGSPVVMDAAVASLYKDHGDLSLKEGQTIRINVNKSSTQRPLSGGLMAKAAVPLLRPPSDGGKPPLLAPPPTERSSSGGAAGSGNPFSTASSQTAAAAAAAATQQPDGWATFD